MWGLFQLSVVVFLFLLPLDARADTFVFTDIMYNPPGADSGAEWVKIQNVSGAPIDMKGWRFAEGGTNHKLTPAGTSIVPAGAYAVIADDAMTFATQNPAFSGVLFDSSFSLNNTGETIAIKNASSTVIAETSYKAPPPEVKAPAAAKAPAGKAKKVSKSTTATTSAYVATPIAALPRSSSSDWSLWPWFVGLGVLIVGASVALFLVPKRSQSGYEIIDTSDN